MDWGLALPEEHRVKMVGSGEHTGPLADDFPRPGCVAHTVTVALCTVVLQYGAGGLKLPGDEGVQDIHCDDHWCAEAPL